MKRVTFLPRSKAISMRPPARAALISIHDASEEEAKFGSGWNEVLYLRFHDTDGGMMGLEEYSEAHAQRALEFVMRQGGSCEHLVVHCQAGQSRSAGLALMIAEALRVPCFKDALQVSTNQYKVYNKRVYGVTWRTAMNDPKQRFLEWSGQV